MMALAMGLGLPRTASPQVAAPTGAPAPAAATVDVKAYEVEGNTLLPAETLEAALQGFKGAATLSRLREAAASVQELYRRAGYGGVVAFVPEQAPTEGRVRIRIVEGRITGIEVQEGKQFKRANMLASVPSLVVGQTPQVRRIDAEIQMANENPAKSLQLLLQPGADAGSIAAKLNVEELPARRITARADNTGGRSNGIWRTALGWQDANFSDRDDVLAGEYQTSPSRPSAVKVASGSYHLPLYGRALALDAFGAWSDVDGGRVETQAGGLQFAGSGVVVGLRVSAYLPKLDEIDQRLVMSVERRDYINSCSVDGLPEGSCGSAGASVLVHPVGVTYTATSTGERRYAYSLGLHGNLGLGGRHGGADDFQAVRQGSRSDYLILRISAQYGVGIEPWGALSLRASGQFAPRPLIPGELFGVGGSSSVRGFGERELSADSGFQLTAEFQGPSLTEKSEKWRAFELRPLLFADAGWVRNSQGDVCLAGKTLCHMESVGIGLRANWQQLQLRADVARALNDSVTTRQGDSRVHVGLNLSY